MRRIFIDTEFYERPFHEATFCAGAPFHLIRRGQYVLDPISIGLVSLEEDCVARRTYYAEFAEFPPGYLTDVSFLRQHVAPKLDGQKTAKTTSKIRSEIAEFLGNPTIAPEVRFYGWYPAADMTILTQLFCGMCSELFKWPGWVYDLRALCSLYDVKPPPELPVKEAHHALNDAKWALDVWQSICRTANVRGYPCP